MGYVEIDLTDADDELMAKYGRIYYKWAQNNTLYLNSTTKTWDSSTVYTQSLMQDAEKYTPNSFTMLFFEYWNYLLAVVIIYFVFAQIKNSKRVKESIYMQEKTRV